MPPKRRINVETDYDATMKRIWQLTRELLEYPLDELLTESDTRGAGAPRAEMPLLALDTLLLGLLAALDHTIEGEFAAKFSS